MGLPALKRLMSMQLDRRRRQVQARHGLTKSMAKRKDLPWLQDDNARRCKKMRYLGPSLPEDICRHIHSLLPLRDAARASCVSHTFLSIWRCHPNLTFSRKTLGLKANPYIEDNLLSDDHSRKIDHILKNHSGIGVKALRLQLYDLTKASACYLNSWLRMAVRPGIEELALLLYPLRREYEFPCSVLLEGGGKSIRDLQLSCCVFRPTIEHGCLRSLTSLKLDDVGITGGELGCLLSNSFALKELELMSCEEIICLKIPCTLQQLSKLVVWECENLEVIESKAPNLSTLDYIGALRQLSVGDSLQNLSVMASGSTKIINGGCAKLLYMVPNLEVLTVNSYHVKDTPVVPRKFLHLKHLSISGEFCPDYDYFFLVSFLDNCPSLETLSLKVWLDRMEHDSVIGDSSDLRRMPGHSHGNIKHVRIVVFCSAKSMFELICHILENASSLERLTLDTTRGNIRCSNGRVDTCLPLSKDVIADAHKALLAVKRYILGKVPSSVELKVLEPCIRCHADH